MICNPQIPPSSSLPPLPSLSPLNLVWFAFPGCFLLRDSLLYKWLLTAPSTVPPRFIAIGGTVWLWVPGTQTRALESSLIISHWSNSRHGYQSVTVRTRVMGLSLSQSLGLREWCMLVDLAWPWVPMRHID